MKKLIPIAVLVATFVFAQDFDWVREWERAQRDRPANVPNSGRIAPASEPGTPLVVHGQIVPPRANVIVFAYQTDRTGVYNTNNARGWRLRGWARSDAKGRFEFQTIRPGSYPRSTNPAHIHITIEGPGLTRRWTDEIQFANDPLLKSGGLPVTTRNGTQHVNYTIRVTDEGKF
jgi:protocatechuate 3,4-dioxygenase beta subunit